MTQYMTGNFIWKPITSTSEMTWHLECKRDFEVSWNCKTTTLFFANGLQRIGLRKERTAGCLTLVCIGCTSVVPRERTVVLRSAEMQNFSAAECRKAIRGNLRNVPHLIFRKLPLDNFPHSAIHILQKYPCTSRICQLADWTTRGLDISWTGQLAD